MKEEIVRKKERNISVDILKSLGIFLIVLAHMGAPDFVNQIRSFDVPLLMILSAYLYKDNEKIDKSFLPRIVKRIIRLAGPVWIFFTLFFAMKFIYCKVTANTFYTFKEIAETYLFVWGVGYVWIFRVYILAACVLPLFYMLKNKIDNKKIFCSIIVAIYIAYEVMYLFLGDRNFILKHILYYIVPYGLICSLVALKIKEGKNLKIYCIISFIIFFICGIYLWNKNGVYTLTSEYKYPARIYYLSYAIGVTFLLWILIENKNIFNIKERLNCKIVRFIASHTMWLYLWHILFLEIFKIFIPDVFWLVKYIIILICSILITFLQSELVKKLNIKNKLILSVLDS